MTDPDPDIHFRDTADGIAPARLAGFFVDWPNPPPPATHLRILAGSDRVVLALDETTGRVVGVVGFVTALTAVTDDVLSAYIPPLEVLPTYQGGGIGSELMTRTRSADSAFVRMTVGVSTRGPRAGRKGHLSSAQRGA